MRLIAAVKLTRQLRGNPGPTTRTVRPMARAMGAIAIPGGVALAPVGPGVPEAANDKHRAKVKVPGHPPVHRATRVGAVRVTGDNPVRAIWGNLGVGEAARGLTVAIKINGKTVCPAVSNLIR